MRAPAGAPRPGPRSGRRAKAAPASAGVRLVHRIDAPDELQRPAGAPPRRLTAVIRTGSRKRAIRRGMPPVWVGTTMPTGRIRCADVRRRSPPPAPGRRAAGSAPARSGSRRGATWGSLSCAIRLSIRTASTGWAPIADSSDSITQSVPSRIALVTSVDLGAGRPAVLDHRQQHLGGGDARLAPAIGLPDQLASGRPRCPRSGSRRRDRRGRP